MQVFELFEQPSPTHKVAILSRTNLNHLTDKFLDIGLASGSFPFLMKILRGETVIRQGPTRSLSRVTGDNDQSHPFFRFLLAGSRLIPYPHRPHDRYHAVAPQGGQGAARLILLQDR